VLVTGPNEREFAGRTTNEIEIREILVGHDFTQESDDALSGAQKLPPEFFLLVSRRALKLLTISNLREKH